MQKSLLPQLPMYHVTPYDKKALSSKRAPSAHRGRVIYAKKGPSMTQLSFQCAHTGIKMFIFLRISKKINPDNSWQPAATDDHSRQLKTTRWRIPSNTSHISFSASINQIDTSHLHPHGTTHLLVLLRMEYNSEPPCMYVCHHKFFHCRQEEWYIEALGGWQKDICNCTNEAHSKNGESSPLSRRFSCT